jgi:excisionase family DNA binding protein
MTLARAREVATLEVTDVADLMGVHVKTAYDLAKRKKIPGRIAELGRMVRFRARVVIAWLEGTADASGKIR